MSSFRGRTAARSALVAAAALLLLPGALAATLLGSAEVRGPILLTGEWDARFDGATLSFPAGSPVGASAASVEVRERVTYPNDPDVPPREDVHRHGAGSWTVSGAGAFAVEVRGMLDASGFAFDDAPLVLEPVVDGGPVVRLHGLDVAALAAGDASFRLTAGSLRVAGDGAAEYLAGPGRERVTSGAVDVLGNPVGGSERDVAAQRTLTVTVRGLSLADATVDLDHAARHGPMAVSANGQVTLRDAAGLLDVGGTALRVAGAPVRLQGPDVGLEFRGVYLEPESGRAVTTAAMRGDASVVEVTGGPSLLPEVATTSLLVALAAGVAYFWPTLRYYGAKLLSVPLYAKLEKDDVLENQVRSDIYDLIKSNPGIHAHGLANELHTGWGTLIYHLHVLEKNHFVTSLRDGRHKRFFPVGLINWTQRDQVAALRNETTKAIFDIIRENPGIIQIAVAERIGLSAPAVKWHVARLLGARLIEQKKVGRTIVYEALGPAPAALGGADEGEAAATA